jgi:hypothetical protein
VLQAVMMDAVKEVSRGVQTSGLVRKITVITGQNQTPLLGPSSDAAEGLKGISARLTASFFPGGGVPDSFPAPVLAAPLETKCVSQ